PVVVGFGATAIGDQAGRTPDDLAIEALGKALESAGLTLSEVEGLYLVPEGYTRASAPLRTQRLATRLGLATRACVEVEGGGTSSMLAFKAACQDVALGHVDVAAVVGAQCERRLFRDGMDAGDLDRVFLINSMYGAWLAPYGVVAALPSYALAGQRYMYEHDLSPVEVAEVAVRLR